MARRYLCNMPCMRPGTRCHKCSRAALGPKRATLCPCRSCEGSCTKKGGQCRKCSEAARTDCENETIGTYEHPPHPDPAMEARLAAMHQLARQRQPLFSRRERDYVVAARAS